MSQQIIFEEEITFTNLPKDNEVPSFPDRSLVSIYKSADLFVMPSIIETFGMVLIEAMAAGLPIITTNAPGCRDVVSNNYNGILVAPKNPEALAKGILRVIENPGLKDSLIKNGKNSIIKYDWGNITQEYEHLYYHIVGKKRLKLELGYDYRLHLRLSLLQSCSNVIFRYRNPQHQFQFLMQ